MFNKRDIREAILNEIHCNLLFISPMGTGLARTQIIRPTGLFWLLTGQSLYQRRTRVAIVLFIDSVPEMYASVVWFRSGRDRGMHSILFVSSF